MRKFSSLAYLAAIVLGAFAFAPAAMACHDDEHTGACEATADGVPLAPVKHDMVAPMLEHSDAVLKLAALEMVNLKLTGAERVEFQKVLAFTQGAQATASSSWLGRILGMGNAVTTETNPWHVSMHALARGTQDLAMRMNKLDGANVSVSSVYNALNTATSFGMENCIYSAKTFNTAEPVAADWSHQQAFLDWAMRLGLLLLLGVVTFFTLGHYLKRLRAPTQFA